MGRRTRTFYRLTSEGHALWSRRENVELPEHYRRILRLVEFSGHKEVIRSQLARYPEQIVEGWLKEFEALNLIELIWVDRPDLAEVGTTLTPPPLEDDEKKRIAAEAKFADISLSRLGVYVDHGRVANRPPNHKAPRSTLALVVEDDPDQLALAVLRLTNAGYRVQGADCVKALVDSLRTRMPDAMFLDVMLPDGDGFDVLATLRQHPAYALLPIIMVTAKSEPESIAKGLALGADAYVTKPYGANTLDYALRYVLQQELPDAHPDIAPVAKGKTTGTQGRQPDTRKDTRKPGEPTEDRLKTHEDVRALLTEVVIYREGDEARTATRWRAVKRVALLVGLVIAILQYYMMDTLYQTVSMQQMRVYVPVTSRDLKSALEMYARSV